MMKYEEKREIQFDNLEIYKYSNKYTNTDRHKHTKTTNASNIQFYTCYTQPFLGSSRSHKQLSLKGKNRGKKEIRKVAYFSSLVILLSLTFSVPVLSILYYRLSPPPQNLSPDSLLPISFLLPPSLPPFTHPPPLPPLTPQKSPTTTIFQYINSPP